MILFAFDILVTGIITFFTQRSLSDSAIRKQTETRASEIAEEAATSVREYPAYKKLLSYRYAHADEMQIEVSVEEIFVNIAHYAYGPETGKATVRVEVTDDPVEVSVTFIDRGVPYDPLAKKDPDITLSAEQREIGGLGIFMTKKIMDNIVYEYKNGSNILKLVKHIAKHE